MIKLTNNQRLILNALISMILTAIVTGVTAIVQANTGQYDVWTLISFGLAAFAGSFGVALYRYIPANIQTELDALRDTQAEIQQNIKPAPVSEPIAPVVPPPDAKKS